MANGNDRILTILLQLKADIADAAKVTGSLKQVEAQAIQTGAAVNKASASNLQDRALEIQRQYGVSAEYALKIATRRLAAEEAIVAAQVKAGAALAANNANNIALAQTVERASAAGASLSNAFFIGAAAGYAIYQVIAHAADEALRLAEEIDKGVDNLVKSVKEWTALAKAAGDFGDVIKLGEKIQPQLDALSAKLTEFRSREITGWQSLADFIDRSTAGARGGATIGFNQKNLDDATAAQEQLVRQALALGNANVDAAQKAEAAWEKVKLEPLTQAVAEYTAKLDELKAKQAGIDRTQSVPQFEEWVRVGNEIVQTSARLDELTKSQSKLVTETERVKGAIDKVDWSNLENPNKLDALSAELTSIQDKLRAIGVEAASPLQALEQAANLTKDNAEAAVKLAGAWATVVSQIGGANSALQAMLDKEGVIRAHAFGSEEEIAKAEWGARYNKILEDRRKVGGDISADTINEAVYAEIIAKERDKDRAAAEREAGAVERTAGASRDILEYTRANALLLEGIRGRQQVIQQNPFLSVDQKDALLAQSITQEIQAMNQQIAAGKALIAHSALDPAQYLQVQQRIQQDTNALELLKLKLSTLSFGGNLRADLFNWANSFGTAAHQVAGIITGTLNTAIGSTSQALTALIFKTGNWKQAFASAAQSIVGNIIQIALQFVVSRLVMAALNAVTGATEATAATTQATTAAAAWAPAATSASIASYGVAAGVGLAAYLAALGSGVAGATALAGVGGAAGAGGFQRGGFTFGSEGRFAGFVHGQEFVFSAPAVRTIGVENLEAAHVAALGKGHEGGGLVGGGSNGRTSSGSSSPDGGGVHVYVFHDLREALRAYNNSSHGRKEFKRSVHRSRV